MGFATARTTVCVCVMLPLVPVTAKTDVPDAVPEATETVRVLLLFPDGMVAGEKLAVTPVGSPPADRATGELKPFSRATVSTNDVEPPTLTLAPVGLGVSVKVGPATVRVNATVRLNPPPVPVTATGPMLAAALAAALTVIVTGAAVVRVGEEKVTVTPVGAPAADSVTGEVNPPCALIVNVAVVD